MMRVFFCTVVVRDPHRKFASTLMILLRSYSTTAPPRTIAKVPENPRS